MGEIADDMLEGTSCLLCGCYFEDPDKKGQLYTHGYPVVCKDCWSDLSKHERKGYTQAYAETISDDEDDDEGPSAYPTDS